MANPYVLFSNYYVVVSDIVIIVIIIMTSYPVAKDLSSTVTLNDGNAMPMFGLGCYLAEPGSLEDAVSYSLHHGYRLFDTAQYYKGECSWHECINAVLLLHFQTENYETQ